MIEDKLTREERLRLECIAQAVAYAHTTSVAVERIIGIADKIYDFVIRGPK